MRKYLLTILLVNLTWMALAIIGCSNRLPVPKVVPVRLQVLAGSKPAVGAIVTLVPEDTADATALRRPKGIVASDGYVTLTTVETGDGAPPGFYKVTVEWPVGAERFSQQQLQEAAYSGDTPQDRWKGKYADPTTTPFDLTIESDGSGLPPIVLPG